MRQPLGHKNHEATGWVVPGAPAVAVLGIMTFLNGYGFLLLSHDPYEGEMLGVGKSCISQHPSSPLIVTLVIE